MQILPIVRELELAHGIIQAGLQAIDPASLNAWAQQARANGINGDSSTRSKERQTILDSAITDAPPAPGEVWSAQGGIYAGIMRGDDSKLYHLIVSDDPSSDIANLAWGPFGKSVIGADSTWDGQANTNAMLDSANDHPAANAIAWLTLSGHSDWYLPAQRELAMCWATVPHLFQKDWYWSSTQFSGSYAWYQSFNDGTQSINHKFTKGRVRAARRLIIQ